MAECVQNGDDERLAEVYAQIFDRQDRETLLVARHFLHLGGEIKTDVPVWLSQAQAHQLTQLSFDASAIKHFFSKGAKVLRSGKSLHCGHYQQKVIDYCLCQSA